MGVLPAKWKGKRYSQLSTAQRGYVTKLSHELKSVILHPAQFAIRKVDEKTARELRKNGYIVKGGKAMIKSDFDGKVSIKRDKKGKVKITYSGRFEEKTVYPITADQIVIHGPEKWIYRAEEKFGANDRWSISIAGKPIGDSFQSIDSLTDYFETYLEKKLGVDARSARLMHIKVKRTRINADDVRSRGQEIKDADKAAMRGGKWRR